MASSRKAMYSGTLHCFGSSKGLTLQKHLITKLTEIFYFKNTVFTDVHFKIFQQSCLPDWNELKIISLFFLSLTTNDNYQNYFLTAVHSFLPFSGTRILSVEERKEIGCLCKRLIDHGRIEYLQQQGYQAALQYYTESAVSLENVLLTAVPNPSLIPEPNVWQETDLELVGEKTLENSSGFF